jgi:hypothetical protein
MKKGLKMKKTKLLLAPLLVLVGLHAKPTEEKSMENTNIKTGTTLGHYQKPGAPIDMTYTSTKVNAGEVADINITLTTSATSGTMHVSINFDEAIQNVSNTEENLTFEITPEQRTFPINIQASSYEDGLHYIRLLTKVDKGTASKLRAFAVPMYVGEPKAKVKSANIMKAMSGENISVSKAVETIEVIE